MPQYSGFKFTNPDKVDSKIWKRNKEHIDIFVPNKSTKAGREMAEFLLNGLKGSRFDSVFEILGLPVYGKFTYPYVEIEGELILLFLGDNQEPKDKNLIEITKREFNELLKN